MVLAELFPTAERLFKTSVEQRAAKIATFMEVHFPGARILILRYRKLSDHRSTSPASLVSSTANSPANSRQAPRLR
jgi:hypothetical protein